MWYIQSQTIPQISIFVSLNHRSFIAAGFPHVMCGILSKLYAYIYIYTYTYTCVYVYIHTYTHIHIYICIYVQCLYMYSAFPHPQPKAPWGSAGNSPKRQCCANDWQVMKRCEGHGCIYLKMHTYIYIYIYIVCIYIYMSSHCLWLFTGLSIVVLV